MKQKGFTFIEMLAVVVLLALLVVIAYPIVADQIKSTNEDLTNSEKEILYNSAYSYIQDNINDYPIRSGNVFCISIGSLSQAGKIPVTIKHVKNDSVVKVTIASDDNLIYDMVEDGSCTETE